MFDLDGFKSINDRFVHVEGNNALVAFSKTLRPVFRASDVVARVGGDEFCVLLPHSTVHEAEVCLSRLRRAVVRALFGRAGRQPGGLTQDSCGRVGGYLSIRPWS
jgi:diguanylate cyclase (GGDEF)-like protein